MYQPAEDLKAFYDSEIGKIVQMILSRHIDAFWPDVHGLRVMGCGYSVPYLDIFLDRAERVSAMMPMQQGVHHWPAAGKNRVLLCEDDRMPIENASIDRLLVVHHFENCDHLQRAVKEVWRVLKPSGRLLFIAPNRTGMWARADWSPFGHGRPFTQTQMAHCLNDGLFTPEHYRSALFVPPLPDSPVMMKSAHAIERWGRNLLPFVAGVHMVEASKRVYARIDDKGSGSPVLAKTKEILSGAGKPAATPQTRGLINE